MGSDKTMAQTTCQQNITCLGTRRMAAKLQYLTYTPLFPISTPGKLTKGCIYFKQGKKTKTNFASDLWRLKETRL